MAKISQYAVDGTPSLSDKLIGTEVGSNNETKNYTLGSILTLFGTGSSGFVPYTGANANVNLGSFDITADSFVKAGGLSTQFLKADGSVDSSTYLTTSLAASTYLTSATAATIYVPYAGATASVDLGANELICTDLTISGEMSADGSVGTSGQVLTSQGSGLPAIWQTPSGGSFTSALIANRAATFTQTPTGLDSPMNVAFSSFSSPELTITPSGTVIFDQVGTYVIRFFINACSGASAPSDNIFFMIRSLVNGSQVYRTRTLFLNPNPNRSTPYEETFIFTVTAPFNSLDFEVMRSSAGLDFGSLVPFSASGGWANIPSAEIQIWKLG